MGKKNIMVDLTKEERVLNYMSTNKKKRQDVEQLSGSKKKNPKNGGGKRQKAINHLNYEEFIDYDF